MRRQNRYDPRLPRDRFSARNRFSDARGPAAREPDWLAHWEKIGIYDRLREKARKRRRKPFILHDGPPYANGHLHIGHALNKTLKDMIVRVASDDGP